MLITTVVVAHTAIIIGIHVAGVYMCKREGITVNVYSSQLQPVHHQMYLKYLGTYSWIAMPYTQSLVIPQTGLLRCVTLDYCEQTYKTSMNKRSEST